jgi:hypothetical protein
MEVLGLLYMFSAWETEMNGQSGQFCILGTRVCLDIIVVKKIKAYSVSYYSVSDFFCLLSV